MAIIYSYPQIGELATGDTIAISDASNGNKTKSVTIGQLHSYINTGQATIIQVDDRVVTGASFNTGSGLLTLTRNGGDIPDVTVNLDNRYYLSSNPNSYTSNLGVVQSLTTNYSSGAATLVNGTLNIPQYSGGSGTDNYVDGGSISGNTLTLTRTGGLSNVNITGLLELGVTSLTALAGNTTTITQNQADDITANNAKVSFPEAPSNGSQYARQNGGWSVVSGGGGGSGTVTSVAATHAGNAFTATIGNTSTVDPSVDITLNGSSSQYIDGAGNLTTFPTITTGTVESVGLSMPAAFSVANSPVTTSGTLTITGAGTTSQYVDGTGALQTFPTIPTVPANIVETVTTTDGSFIDLTPDTATDGAVTITADLSATGTADNTTFLRGDNTWAVPSGGGGGVTEITTTAPITGGTITTTGTIGITQASGSADGYLSSTDWNTFNSKSTFDGQFSSLSNTPTTIAGYGITDALQLGTTSTTALAGNTAIPSATSDLTNDSGFVEGTTSTQTAITEIKTLTSTEYGNTNPKLNNVMYVIV